MTTKDLGDFVERIECYSDWLQFDLARADKLHEIAKLDDEDAKRFTTHITELQADLATQPHRKCFVCLKSHDTPNPTGFLFVSVKGLEDEAALHTIYGKCVDNRDGLLEQMVRLGEEYEPDIARAQAAALDKS